MCRLKIIAATALIVIASAGTSLSQIAKRPEQLKLPDLSFTVPDAGSMRFVLANGIPVYAKADTQLPLVTVTVLFRGGSYMDPPGKEGLASIAGEVWRTGGAGDRNAQQLDEDLDFLAADLSTSIDDVSGRVRLNVMSKDLDTAMPILMDVLTAPRFQADRFAKAKDDLIQELKKRNDDSANIEAREWNRLIYGDDYWVNHLPTKASVDAIADADCRSFVTSLARAGNVVVAVAGDFNEPALKSLLDRTLGTLPQEASRVPPVPQPDHIQEPGVYLVDKPDVNQGRVSVGQLGFRLGDPEQSALLVMNEILGGGGFTSRITKRVRSDKGLAYSAGSYMTFPVTYPGFFRALFQSKSRTCAGALGITMRLIRGMGKERVSAGELETARSSFLLTFPRRFESAEKTATLFAGDELLGRPHSYWTTYRERIAAVDAADVLHAAKTDLHPDRMVVLVVGNSEEILKGHPDYPDKLGDFGPIHKVPLRDPLTLAPLTEKGK
jgi:zinc protease